MVTPRGKAWDGRRLHLIKRKWLAGHSSAKIHEETGWGRRRIDEEIAKLRKQFPKAPVGRRRLPLLRRVLSVEKALSCTKTGKTGRSRPPTAEVVNGEVRRVTEFRETSVRTTSRDMGARRVVRSIGIWWRRQVREGNAARTLRQIVAAALKKLE